MGPHGVGEPGPKSIERHEAGEEVTLGDIASHPTQLAGDIFGLHTLGHDTQTEVVSQIDDGADDGAMGRIGHQVGHESLVDLQFMDRKR